ncbi:MAG: ABA4-like family protein [Waterburya sp.]
MTFSDLFNLSNLYAMFFWALIILLPNWLFTKKIMHSLLFLVPLIGLYIYYLFATLDSESVAILANPRLENVARFFSKEGAAGAGWVHFLIVDLFLGRWIYWQGQEKKMWTKHSLILCLFFGPVGLLSHIVTTYFFGKQHNAETAETETMVS